MLKLLFYILLVSISYKTDYIEGKYHYPVYPFKHKSNTNTNKNKYPKFNIFERTDGSDYDTLSIATNGTNYINGGYSIKFHGANQSTVLVQPGKDITSDDYNVCTITAIFKKKDCNTEDSTSESGCYVGLTNAHCLGVKYIISYFC